MSHSSLETGSNSSLSMSNESVELLVRQTIANRLRIDIQKIQLDTNIDDLNLDSLDLAELFFLLEDQLKRQLTVNQTTDLKNIRDIVMLVMQTQ
jgi:acyl carrier protein